MITTAWNLCTQWWHFQQWKRTCTRVEAWRWITQQQR